MFNRMIKFMDHILINKWKVGNNNNILQKINYNIVCLLVRSIIKTNQINGLAYRIYNIFDFFILVKFIPTI